MSEVCLERDVVVEIEQVELVGRSRIELGMTKLDDWFLVLIPDEACELFEEFEDGEALLRGQCLRMWKDLRSMEGNSGIDIFMGELPAERPKHDR